MGKRKKKETKVSPKKEREEALKALLAGGKLAFTTDLYDDNGEPLADEVVELLERQE